MDILALAPDRTSQSAGYATEHDRQMVTAYQRLAPYQR